jgi:8-oxo-dGTP diphosphatase
MAEHYRHSVSVAGVATDDAGRVLVIRRRDNGAIQAPGGILEQDEQITDGVRREVLEETGYTVEPRQLTGVYKHMTLGVVALVYRCDLIGGGPVVNDEASEVLWMDPAEVQRVMTEAFAIRVADALDEPWPHVRHHDGTNLLAAVQQP